jgi:hypothetical protein
MPLDEKRQALLDVFCHCYEKLLDHLDALEEPAQAHPEWSNYRIVKECFNPAVEAFGSAEVKTLDLSTLCSDFLSRTEGFIIGKLSAASPVGEVFAEYRAAVRASPISTQADLTSWQRLGEELSKEYYQDVLPVDSPNLTRAVQPVCIESSNKEDVGCELRKDTGESKITFYFASPKFVLQSYVNLPLYFLHEYLSHIHTAPLFGELSEIPKPFEDGWLLYCIRAVYRHRLLHDPHPSLTHHLYREHYAEQYFLEQNIDANNQPWVPFGYEHARRFEEVVGVDLFRKVTLLVATSPYSHFPDIPNLHWDFVKRVADWLAKMTTLAPAEKGSKIRRLAEELEKKEALRQLLEFLIEK